MDVSEIKMIAVFTDMWESLFDVEKFVYSEVGSVNIQNYCYVTQWVLWYSSTEMSVPRKPCTKRSWTKAERDAVTANLGCYMYINRLPGKRDILNACQHHPALHRRSWQNIKDFVRNTQLKNSKFICKWLTTVLRINVMYKCHHHLLSLGAA